jgi:hypothetical protein
MDTFCLFYHLQTMETFAPGDRVVAINIDVSVALRQLGILKGNSPPRWNA